MFRGMGPPVFVGRSLSAWWWETRANSPSNVLGTAKTFCTLELIPVSCPSTNFWEPTLLGTCFWICWRDAPAARTRMRGEATIVLQSARSRRTAKGALYVLAYLLSARVLRAGGYMAIQRIGGRQSAGAAAQFWKFGRAQARLLVVKLRKIPTRQAG